MGVSLATGQRRRRRGYCCRRGATRSVPFPVVVLVLVLVARQPSAEAQIKGALKMALSAELRSEERDERRETRVVRERGGRCARAAL